MTAPPLSGKHSSGKQSRGQQSSTDLVRDQHLNWLGLVEVSGPFLTLPVLRQVWSAGLDPLDREQRRELRREHTVWQEDLAAGRDAWVRYVLGGLLGWGEDLRTEGLESLAMEVAEHDTRVEPSFVLTEPGAGADGAAEGDSECGIQADRVRLLGLVCPAGQSPQQRIKDESWSATPVDRLAQLCRHHGVELGLATDGRWWVLVWAPKGGVTTTAVFDASLWTDSAERDVLRAFYSLLNRRRFFGVPDEERLVKLLAQSMDSQEEVTEALGVQVRQAVELLVAAIGRADTRARERGGRDLSGVSAHDVYRGSVSVMMRVVFLLFAEERGLLPSDNDLYARAYSAGGLYQELHEQAREGTEDDLERTTAAWHRLLALFNAVYGGVDHPRLKMHPLDGSLFNPETFPWMPLDIDDRTVLHMLKAVQYVRVGRGKSAELRKLSFRALDVEQIGYVYEGLLSFDGFRAEDLVVGLIGKEGAEEEVQLRDLEELSARHTDVESLATELATKYKDSKIGTKGQLAKRLAPMDRAEQEEARKKLRGVLPREEQLVERLLPFFEIIRLDLRGLPLVIRSGELYVTDSSLRKNTGTHYTPRFLAEEVVEGALEPLVYEPGPLQTADTSEWKLKSSKEILSLKVADIAVGSAAFLVAAARYLGDRLIEAWVREGDERVAGYTPPEDGLRADDDKVVIEARRQVIEHSLYGVDINPMAVEMAKLSLWLVSMDPKRPFTFLDDRLAAGDSLLGITSLEQLEYMHMDPKKGRKIHERGLVDFTAGVRELVANVAASRRELAKIDGATLEGLNRKRSILGNADVETSKARLLADLVSGSALASSGKSEAEIRASALHSSDLARRLETAEPEARLKTKAWLNSSRPSSTFERNPLHWPLKFPEAFENGGFDAVIGNPPFLGGDKITSSLGSDMRSYLVANQAGGRAGKCDLVGYFSLQATNLIKENGNIGIIATDSLAQGETREVALSLIIERGVEIYQATKSKAWPSKSANLSYCVVWATSAQISEKIPRKSDGKNCRRISSWLTEESNQKTPRNRLNENFGITFEGVKINGIGFTLTPGEADALISSNQSNSEVLFPYLNGQDVNSRPDSSASRWIINFFDWPEEKAQKYRSAFSHVEKNVKPDRQRLKSDGSYALSHPLPQRYWQYGRTRPEMREATANLDRVIVLTRVSKTVMPMLVDKNQVISDRFTVFASSDPALLALLSGSIHYWWFYSEKTTRGSAGDPQYSPIAFETFALPRITQELRALGEQLETYRKNVMLSRNSGLTKTYNLVFDPGCSDPDIQEIRNIHRAIDEATIRAYNWEERIKSANGLDHGFHETGKGLRYTIGPSAQRVVLDSLLEENQRRYAEEVAQGLHEKKKSKRTASSDEETLF